MNTFFEYARFYDALYHDKPFIDEQQYIMQLVEQYGLRVESILDLGCGTGAHAICFAEDGYRLEGVDVSESMLELAEAKKAGLSENISENLQFHHGDVRSIRLNRKYDLVVSLFHVASYQTEDEDIINFFSTADSHLNDNGLFIFDFWYGPAVLKHRPENKTRVLKTENTSIKRHTRSAINTDNHSVEINFTIEGSVDGKKIDPEVSELHVMRYFFREELRDFLLSAGLEMLNLYCWMTFENPSDDCWYGLVIAKKR